MSANTLIPSSVTSDAPGADLVLTYPECARLLRLSVRSLNRLCETGEAPPRIHLTGRRIGFWRRDVLAWLQARTAPVKQVV